MPYKIKLTVFKQQGSDPLIIPDKKHPTMLFTNMLFSTSKRYRLDESRVEVLLKPLGFDDLQEVNDDRWAYLDELKETD